MQQTIQLENDYWQIRLQPEIGVQTTACRVHHNSRWLDVMPDCEAEESLLEAANFHMLPYSNRIRDARFTFLGNQYTLTNAAKHAIHGALRDKPWQVLEKTADRLECHFSSEQHINNELQKYSELKNDINWPWPMQANIEYWLDEHLLCSKITLTNSGESVMPAGMGWHPYFCRTIEGATPELTLPVSAVYPTTDGDCLPTGPAETLPAFLDFRRTRKLDPSIRIDHCLAGFSGKATIAWPKAGISLQMLASEHCQHAVLFNPDKPFFALEPVTNANDAFNLADQGIAAGAQTLAPGESLSASMSLALQQI